MRVFARCVVAATLVAAANCTSAAVLSFTTSFATESFAHLEIVNGISLTVHAGGAKGLSFNIAALHSAALQKVEIIPTVRVTGEFDLAGAFGVPPIQAAAGLVGNFHFTIEDIGDPVGTPIATVTPTILTDSMARLLQCDDFVNPIPSCPREDSYTEVLFGAPIEFTLPHDLNELRASSGLRLLFDAGLDLQCTLLPFARNECTATNDAEWAGDIELRLTLRDPAAAASPGSLVLLGVGLLGLLARPRARGNVPM